MPTNPLTKMAAQAMGRTAPRVPVHPGGAVSATNAFGVPAIAPRVTSLARGAGHAYARAAGDPPTDGSWTDSLNGQGPLDNFGASTGTGTGGDQGVGDLLGGSLGTGTGTGPSNQQLLTQQNIAAINAVSGVLGTTGQVITSAIQSGNQVEIARIQSQTAQHIADLQAQIATSPNNAQRLQLQQQLQSMQQVNALMQQLNVSNASKTYLLIGGAALLGLGALYFMTRGGGGARRNPAPEAGWPHYNPVMERTHVAKRGRRKGKRVHDSAWFSAADEGRARRRGWKKAR